MDQRTHYTKCPVCGSEKIDAVFKATDHTVSKEVFNIVSCTSCTLRFTQDVPNAASIDPYYKSEDYISHTNTSKGIINRLYQFARKRTLANKRRLIEKSTGIQKGALLDVGCGTGSFINEMKQSGWQVTGLEPDDGARKIAAEIYNIRLEGMDQFYKLPAGSFDVITLWHVLEHVHDLAKYVGRLKNLLKDDGRIFIAVPNYTSLDAIIYKEYWAAYDVPRHLYHFSPRSMETLMQQHGLKIRQYKPMWFDSFYIALLSSKYKNGKTNWIAAAWNGLRSNFKALGNTKRCSSVIYIISK
jgi:2-polyprenyl-3-methyl-5-hydroxy-6-metoxy-1,4-benzoquinol methylase